MNLSEIEQFAKELPQLPYGSNFAAQHPVEYEWIQGSKFDFAAKMREVLNRYGSLTPGQFAAVQKCMRWTPRPAAAPSAAPVEGVEPLFEAFQAAKRNGLKYPKVRLERIVFSLAGEASRNPGAIYIKFNKEYVGKLTAEGRLQLLANISPDAEKEIRLVCANPLIAIVASGLKTGRCSCCGAELTNAESIRLGIGPICREKWGL